MKSLLPLKMKKLTVLALAFALTCTSGCTEPAGVGASDSPLSGVSADLLTQRGGLTFVTGFENGRLVADSSGRPTLAFFTADWCTYCHQMEGDAFKDQSVMQLSEQFVCVLIDADQEAQLCRRLGVQSFPTIQFFSSRGESLHRLKGRQSREQLLDGMNAALERIALLRTDAELVR